MAERLDDRICLIWLARPLHPEGLACPHGHRPERRLFRPQGDFPAYRCRACDGYSTLLTDTVVEKTRPRPATLVLLRRGMAKGEPTARFARELGLSRKPRHTWRQRVQTHLHHTAPVEAMTGTALEADARYQHAGKTSTPHRHPSDPPRRRANQRQGHGTSAHDRPPLIRIISRDTGEPRWWVGDHADTRTCRARIADNIPADRTRLYTDAWQSDRGSHPAQATVRPGVREWARDADGDGRCAVHGHTCEGAGAALRTYWRAFRGVHKPSRHLDVATYEAMVNAKCITPELIRRMCRGDLSRHSDYT